MRALFTCGNGVFPEQFKVDVPMWEAVSKYCVRAAVPPMSYSPLIDDVIDFGVQYRNTPSVTHACCVCHKTEAEGGGELKKCGRCSPAKYCSAQCQRVDWKKHKATCLTGGK